MRIHFPDYVERDIAGTVNTAARDATLSPYHIAIKAMNECQDRGTIASHVSFDVLEAKRRKGGGTALEIKLCAAQWDRGRRARYDLGESAGNGTFAATFDECGFFLAALYRLSNAGAEYVEVQKFTDAAPVTMLTKSAGPGDFFVGSVSAPLYLGEAHFHHRTGRTYDLTYPDRVEADDLDYYCFRSGLDGIGRRGAGRVHYAGHPPVRTIPDPRSADWLRKFQAGEVL